MTRINTNRAMPIAKYSLLGAMMRPTSPSNILVYSRRFALFAGKVSLC